MSRTGGRVWVVCMLACLLGCSSSDPVPMRDFMRGAGTGGGFKPPTNASGAAGNKAPPTGPITTDNPNGAPIQTIPDMTAAGAPAMPMGGGPMQMCEAGKFCEPAGPDGNCGSMRLDTDLKQIQLPGNILVIFDRSTSMEDPWNGVPRWQAAGEAFANAIKPLSMLLNVGAIFFPSPAKNDPNNPCPIGCNVADPFHWIPGPGACCLNLTGVQACDVNAISDPDQIKFGPAMDFLTQAPMKWRFNGLQGVVGGMGPMGMMAPTLIGATPLGAGVKRAAEAITATKLDGPLVVVILTDGAPNCDTNQQQVIQQVTTWKGMNIATHVIGLPGSGDAAAFLTSLAMAGGTTNYLDPMNAQELEAKLKMILTTTIRAGFESCEFKLEMATMVPEKLHLVVTEGGKDKDVPRDLSKDPNWGADAGWKINKEGDTVEITGRLCDLAKEGNYESIRFDYGCVDLPPPDPPMGPS